MKKFYNFKSLAQGVRGLFAVMLITIMALGNVSGQAFKYMKVSEDQTDWSGTYLLVGQTGTNYFAFSGFKSTYGKYDTVTTLVSGVDIVSNATTNGYQITIAKQADNTYTIATASGEYLGWNSSNSLAHASAANGTKYHWNISMTGSTLTIANDSVANRKLQWNSGSPRFACYTSNMVACQLYKLTEYNPNAPATPIFTPVSGVLYGTTVSIVTATEGATIYYTTDGTTPDATSSVYSEPITVSTATTIKAIAIKDTNVSFVATASYTIPVSYSSIAAMKANGTPNEVYNLYATLRVIYQNGQNLFVQDNTGALLIYGNAGKTYNAGDYIYGGIYGKFSLYQGMKEMAVVSGAPAMADGEEGSAIAPIVVTVADLIANIDLYESKLVTIENVTFTGGRNFSQDGNTMSFYDKFGAFASNYTVEAGRVANVTGLVNINNGNVEILPRTAADFDFAAELPVTVNFDDQQAEGWVIDNATGNNKWYIGQAQGFDNNKLYISSTNGATNKYGEGTSRASFSRFINIPAVGANLAFDARVNGESDFDYLTVKFNSQILGTFVMAGEWTNYTINMAPEMAGAGTLEFVWQNDGSVQNQFPAAIDNISITPIACAQVTNLNTTVNANTATITWDAPADQTAWTVEYKLANHTEWYSVAATTASVTLNNLQGNSNYDVRVKANCGEANSLYAEGSFTIECQNAVSTTVNNDKEIGTESTNNSYLPFYGLYNYTYSQQIFDASEINVSNGLIYSISFKCNSTPNSTSTGGIRIWMANTTKSVFNNNTDYVDVSDLTQVYYNSDNYVYSSGWNTFVFDTPFAYDGTSNLLVAYYEGNGSYSPASFKANSTSSHKSIVHYSDNQSSVSYTNPASASGSKYFYNYRNYIKLNMDATTVVCNDTISCPDMVGVEAINVTPNAATINWTTLDGSNQNNFMVEYQAEGSETWTSVSVQDMTLALSDLAQLTTYNVRVKAICGENDYSSYVTTSFTTAGICPVVTNIATTSNANTATLTWTAGGSENGWTVQFRPVGTNDWTTLHVSIVPMVTLGGLVGNTDYEVRIKAICDAEDEANQSAWVTYNFTSGCAAVDVPYAQVFGSYNQPDCWTGNIFDFSYSTYAATNDNDGWLMSPAINIPANGTTYVSFMVNATGNYKLMASYRGTSLARFAEIYAGTSADNEVVVAIPEIYNGRMVNFMFQNGVDNWFKVYNMRVNACPYNATDLATSNLNSNSVDLSWQSDASVTAWNVEYRENGGEWTSLDVTANPYTLTGLTASTAYQVRVKTACNETYSNTVSFTTPCPAIAVPYTQNFEASVFPPECWSMDYVSGTHSWTRGQNSTYGSGTYDAKFTHSSTGSRTKLITPMFDMSTVTAGILSFKHSQVQWGGDQDELTVYYRTSTSAPWVELVNYTSSMSMTTETITLPADAVASTCQFAFEGYDSYGYGIYLDDVTVEQAPTCAVPSIEVSNGIATITAGTFGTPVSYDLQIGNEIVTGVQSPADLTVLFQSLAANTEYEVLVRANCGSEDNSEWSAPVTFNTPCTAISLNEPYFQGFEDATFVPQCWDNYHVSGPGTSLWQRNSSSYYSHSGSASAKIPDMRATTYTNLVSPAFIIPQANAYKVSLWVYRNVTGTSKQNEGVKVYANTTPTVDGNAVELFHAHRYTGFAPVMSSTGWCKYEATIPVAGDRVYIIFQGICEYGSATYIDDITIEHVPSCEVPSVAVSGTTLTITPNLPGTPESYDLHIDGFQDQTVTTTSVDLTTVFAGLSSGINYQVSVRSNCGADDYSAWSTPVVFSTPCGIASLPFFEDFNSYTSGLPNCWEKIGSGSVTVQSSYAYSGYSIRFSGSTSNVVALPQFESNNLSVSFYTRPEGNNASCGQFDVGYVDESNTFTAVQTYSYNEIGAQYQQRSLEVMVPAGSKLAFRHRPTQTYWYWFVDNINIEALPTCFAPTALTAEQTDNSVTLSWTDSHNQANYVVEYKEDTASIWNTLTTTNTSIQITGLTPSTDYNVRVKADCGEGDYSAYATADFSTYCLAYYIDEDGSLVCPNPTDLSITGIETPMTACTINAPVVVTLQNTGFLNTISNFTIHYTLNDVDSVTENVTLDQPLAVGATMTHTFATLPVYALGFNTVKVWVEMEDVELTNNVVFDYPYLVTPNTVPYVMNTVDESAMMGWNSFDANNDAVKMTMSSRVIRYAYNDEAAANDWMISPCFNLTAGAYNIIFDYNANSALNENFELYYGTGATPDAMTQMLSQIATVDNQTHTATVTVNVPADGTYNFGFKATSLAGNLGFQIRNIQILPVLNVVVTTDGNGTTNPTGNIAVNYGENLSLAITPNEMYHVGGIYVDGTQVMNEDPYNANFMLYTLENVTANHTVNVDFKLEFHIIKSVENYNAAYTDVPGYFVPAATDTLIDPNAYTVTFAPAAHYHFTGLELGVMSMDAPADVTANVVDNNNGTYSYTIDTLVAANYYLNATFRRDTVNIHYNVLNGQGTVDASANLVAPAQYDTWYDYDVMNDQNHTMTITPAANYHIVNVNINGNDEGAINTYNFSNLHETQNVNVKFGYEVNASIRNYVASYLGSSNIRGNIAPATQLVPEFDSMTVTGTIENHFHLYNLFVNGEDRIYDVVFNGNNYSYTMPSIDNNYEIEAVVKIDTFGIHYDIQGGDGVIDGHDVVANSTMVTMLNYGEDFLSTIAAVPGYHIVSVTVDGVNYGNIDDWQFNFINAEHFVNVVYAPNDITISTTAYGQGTVSAGETFTYNPAHTYVFTATPAQGYHIESLLHNTENVAVADAETAYTETLTNIVDNHNYVVTFAINTYNITATAGANGTVSPAGVTVYNYGADANYAINAETGYYIASVTVDGTTTDYTQADAMNSTVITFANITAGHTVAATFAQYQYTITVNAGANGAIAPATDTYAYGATPTFTITPNAGYGIVDVTVDGVSVGAVDSYTFTALTANHTIAATFAQYQYTITATAGNNGTITPAGVTNMIHNGNQSYTITPATGYHIADVYVDGASVGAVSSYNFTSVTANHTIYAMFAANEYTITVNQPAHGTITPGTMTVAYGATPTFVITPAIGYNVATITLNGNNVMSNATNVNGIYTYTLPAVAANATLTATMSAKTYTITATAGAHGTIAPAGATNVNFGGNQAYTITPAAGYVIEQVTVDGINMGAIGAYTFVNVVANHTINATFTYADCEMPTNMHVINLDSTSATLTWYHPGATSFDIQYKALNEATYTSISGVTGSSYDLTNLLPSTNYVWHIQANCAAGNHSEMSNGQIFTTLAAPVAPEIDTTGVENYVQNLVKVYGVNNNIYVVNNNNVNITNIQVYDIYGQLLYNGQANSNPEVISMNVAAGTYMVRLATDKGFCNYKLYLRR